MSMLCNIHCARTCILKFPDIDMVDFGGPVHDIAVTSTTYAVVTTEKQVKVITCLFDHEVGYGCMFVFFLISVIIIF